MSRSSTLLALTVLALPALSQTPVANPPTLFLIGDSTVRNGNGTGANNQLGWGEPLAAYFDSAKIQVLNRARGGRSSRTFLTEGLWDQVLDNLKSCDFVIMQFVHNDRRPLHDNQRARVSPRRARQASRA